MQDMEQPWWKHYRRRMHKGRPTLNTETILRRSCTETLREYIRCCSLPAIGQIFRPGIDLKQRILWLVVFNVLLGGIVYFLRYLWVDTLGTPLIVTMESGTYPIAEIDFPAVALCNVNRLSRKAVLQHVHKIKLTTRRNKTLSELEWYLMQAGRLLDFSYNGTLIDHELWDDPTKYQRTSRVIVQRMQQLAPKCEEMLIKCSWSGEEVACSDLFKVRRTSHGHCCAFNYVLNYNSAGEPHKSLKKALSQEQLGPHHGLTVIMDPMLEDYAYPLSPVYGIDIFMFDPLNFADPSGGRVIHRLAEPDTIALIELKSIKQTATAEVKKYDISTRNCMFHNENFKEFFGMYSFSACLTKCRTRTVQSLCKCTPYFVPISINDGRICNYDDLRCLNKYKEKLMYIYPRGVEQTEGLEVEIQNSVFCPECLPDCEFTKHTSTISKTPMPSDPKVFTDYFMTDLNMTSKCFISIYQFTGDGVLNRLDVVFYWYEIMSGIGGMSGLLIGFSFIGVAEYLYFTLVRFPIKFYCNFKKYH